ncbi:hypothetical protein DNTS_014049 [Danionella cerebrum]|uniref:Uncharacterized protein n=1 Tax=Danionella cerebrum TaxID=2873325 RepID=A0A553NIG0_9TELE|nr:hypothetical protein DNTS_014049 [Danionella translucida]
MCSTFPSLWIRRMLSTRSRGSEQAFRIETKRISGSSVRLSEVEINVCLRRARTAMVLEKTLLPLIFVSEMIGWSQMAFSVLFWMLSLASTALLRSEFKGAYVTDRYVFMCTDLPFCEHPNATDHGNCRDQYTSPLNVALLLNNSEIRHLSLVQCQASSEPSWPFEYFTVQRLETLHILFPLLSVDLVLGRDRDAPYYEEARMAVIHLSVLKGNSELKSYTVQTQADHRGLMNFPDIHMSHNGLLETSRMFVTFLY